MYIGHELKTGLNLIFYTVKDIWVGPTNEIWTDDQCNNVGNRADLGHNVDQCKQACRNTVGCTAINFRKGFDCVLRACREPVVQPSWSYSTYVGYYIGGKV